MKVSEHLLLELLTVSRMYMNIPYLQIHSFVVYSSKQTLETFLPLHQRLYNRLSPAVDLMLDDILAELSA